MWGRRGLELCRAVVQHARAEARVLTLMYEIPSGSSSFYRGFGSMISCACRTISKPSNSNGVQFCSDSVEIFSWRKFPSVVRFQRLMMRGM
jgi:hypothetical protein